MVWVQRHQAPRREKARVGQNSEPIVKIDRTDEWPKFDQRTNLFGLCLGSVLSHEKFSRTHVVHRPRPRTPAFFPLQIAFYKSLSFSFSLRSFFPSFFFTRGALGFFSYPLAGHLPLRKGRPRCRIRKREVKGGKEEGCAASGRIKKRERRKRYYHRMDETSPRGAWVMA